MNPEKLISDFSEVVEVFVDCRSLLSLTRKTYNGNINVETIVLAKKTLNKVDAQTP